MICRHYQNGQQLDVAGLNVVTVLVDRSETQLTEVGWNRWRKGLAGPPHSHEAKEQILYVTDGEGIVVVGPARYAVKPGSLMLSPLVLMAACSLSTAALVGARMQSRRRRTVSGRMTLRYSFRL